MSDDLYDNEGEGRCPVKGCDGWVSGGTCMTCGEDFAGPEWEADVTGLHHRHVVPTDDEIQHDTSQLFGEYCVCGPTVRMVDDRGWVFTHHSLDGREQAEEARPS